MNKLHILGMTCAYIILSIFSAPALSSPIYPYEIQTCIYTAICSNPKPVQQGSTFNAYSYSDAGIAKFLFEYLDPPSRQTNTDSTTALSGSIWVSANERYNLTQNRHFFNLYLDRISPTPFNLWLGDSNGLDVRLSLPSADLLAGSSSYKSGFLPDFFITGGLGTHGDSWSSQGQSLVPCLASSCIVGAEFTLLNMQYIKTGSIAHLIINPVDPREPLFHQYSEYENRKYFTFQSYGVVPVPSAVWLFGSSLIGLISVTKRIQ